MEKQGLLYAARKDDKITMKKDTTDTEKANGKMVPYRLVLC